MIIVKSPLRISFFGGSTDYKDFYEKSGSFIIGTTIDKYAYLSMRIRPSILSSESVITYSKMQIVQSWEEIQNPLIREVFKYKNISVPIEFSSFSDVPSRTGLGGSSTFCAGLIYLINKVFNIERTKKNVIDESIKIEREILKESGGIQDSIWPVYGGLNSIEIKSSGKYLIKPLPVTEEFQKEFQNSLVLIYTNQQRNQNIIAKSHENTDRSTILSLSKIAYNLFLSEDIKSLGLLLHESWKEKKSICSCISNSKIDEIENHVLSLGVHGIKLLGAGGCGFLLVVCDPIVKRKIYEFYKSQILEFKFEQDGIKTIYS
jgi:D-glycero-alpha-D-manno-heptose-7-phosphate kinase